MEMIFTPGPADLLVVVVVLLSLVAIPILFLSFLAWGLVQMLRRSGRDTGMAPEDTRMLQELHQGLTRLENRVENLETLLVHRGGTGEKGTA